MRVAPMMLALLVPLPALLPGHAHAQATGAPTSTVLFQNVHIFDGTSDRLSKPMNVLVRGNRIERISATPVPTDQRADTVVIDGGGRTLMPGLIDMHWHTMYVRPTPTGLMTDDLGYTTLAAGVEATDHHHQRSRRLSRTLRGAT